ncbi:transcriptional corepressor [Lichtheimia corymbifera JMRC:FSU:9682]|uniref:Transcriptional corepressor n=1 Tax=Lichtheimia corymbifera JMRC:FSU:9682 TaxID=1263082 RepID=A0A068SER7_9FUNG|nr:transcriptional corepressor [Lichtheimia corymbifera JMRC:FSU:9682]
MAATTPQQQHQQQAPPQQPQQPPQQPQQPSTAAQKLAAINEQTWLSMGNLAELMTDYDKATSCYESALRHNPYSVPALTQIASLCRGREQFGRAVDYFKRILAIQENNGETWAALGHCYLMMDNLQDAYHAYQQALYHLSNPKDPKLWYGIGILYDRYGSLEHAEEAFSAVMKMDPKFEKANEIYFRLGIIYKQQQKFDLSLQCFRYILHTPPRPLTESDIWFQTGHVYEQQKEYELAKEAYERVLAENPDHAKVLQQLGWLYHQQNTSFCNQTLAIQYLTRSLKSDSNDAQSWYLLGRCYMAEQNYNKAYEAYQQAVYRDARNPTFWCSIGVLYYQINQYRDALDAYSRAIRLNPYISEVWYDLGTLYESCNNQVQDALDAYQRAAELDPSNPHIKQRLELLRKSQSVQSSQGVGSAPAPRDVSNPNQYQNNPGTQPLNGGYNQQAPGPALSSMSSSYGNAPPPPRPDERGGMPVPQTAQENGSGPGRDLPALATGQGERAPPGSHQYQPSPSREDVRIPGIGGGQAPAPSDRSQMNPIVAEDAKQRVRQTPPPPPSAVSDHAPPPPPQQRHSPFMKSEEPRTAAPPPPQQQTGLQPRGGVWQQPSESPRSAHAPATPYDQHHRSPVAREPVDTRMSSRPDGHQSPYARRDYPNEGPRTPVMKHEHPQQQQQQQQPEEPGRGYHIEQPSQEKQQPQPQPQPSPQPQHQQQQQQSPAPPAATTTPAAAAPAEEQQQQQPSHVQPMDTTPHEQPQQDNKPEKSHEEQQQQPVKESTPAPSQQQQDTSAAAAATSRAPVDEDYDESAASALLSMGGNRDNGAQGYKNEGQKRAYSAEESDVSQEGVKRARSGEEESSKPAASEATPTTTTEKDQSVPSPKQQSSPSPQQQPATTTATAAANTSSPPPASEQQQQQPKKEESPAPTTAAAAPSSTSAPSTTTTQQQQEESPVEDAKEEGEVTDKTPSPSA